MKALGCQKLDFIERDNPLYEPAIFKVLEDVVHSEPSNRSGKGEVHGCFKSL